MECEKRTTYKNKIEPQTKKISKKNLFTGVRSITAAPGLSVSAIVWAQALPNTTKSSKEFAPKRLAPWTDAHAASPQAYKPGTILSPWTGS